MTLLEKAMAEHSGIEESEIVRMICPEDLGYVNSARLCQGGGYEEAGFDRCWDCWNREAGDTGETPSTAEAVPLPQTRQAAGDGKRVEGGAGDGG